MPEFSQSLGFDLPDPFPRDFEVLTDFFQCMIGRLPDSEPLPDYMRMVDDEPEKKKEPKPNAEAIPHEE